MNFVELSEIRVTDETIDEPVTKKQFDDVVLTVFMNARRQELGPAIYTRDHGILLPDEAAERDEDALEYEGFSELERRMNGLWEAKGSMSLRKVLEEARRMWKEIKP